jgi:hypothetical protein
MENSRFKEKLLADPRSALMELGVQIPDVNIRVIEENQGTWTFILPASPAATRDISDAELSLSGLGGPIVNQTTLLVCTTGCSS